jgi:hypothetical protein
MESGGLIGTYYNDLHFYDRAKWQVDERVHFTSKEWGPFGPDIHTMHPWDYTIRWHGYLSMDGKEDQYFKLIGTGEAKVYIDDELVMDWTYLGSGEVFGSFDMSGYISREVEIYYRHYRDTSLLSFQFQDETGKFSPLPSRYLHHPTNYTSIATGQEAGVVEVITQDWVGHTTTSSIEVFSDLTGPRFDLSGNDRWVSTVYPELSAVVWDPSSETVPNSDIDTGSIEYRIRRENETWSDWFDISSLELLEDDQEPLKYITVFDLQLAPDWTGFYQLRASDRSGNIELSPQVPLGVDLKPPRIDVISPPSGSKITGSEVNITIRATDIGGSGFDGMSLMYRYQSDEVWTQWRGAGENIEGEEVMITSSFSLPFGIIKLQFKGTDILGNLYTTTHFTLSMEPPVINRKPIPMIASPLNNTLHEFGRPVLLSAEGTMDDGVGVYGQVRFTWISNVDGVLGTVPQKEIFLSKGDHRITLYVDDGAPGHNVSIWVTITVFEPDYNGTGPIDPIPEEDTGWAAFVIVFFVVITTVVVLLVIMFFISKRKQFQGQAQLGVKKRTEDDLEYDLREDEYDLDRGYSIETGEWK